MEVIMTINDKQIRMTSSDGTVVLILTVAVPSGVSPRVERFYSDGASAFEKSVRERLLIDAQNAYRVNPDRRKRYRFQAWRAEFRCIECDGGIELVIAENGNIMRHERHIWRGGNLIKRIRMKTE